MSDYKHISEVMPEVMKEIIAAYNRVHGEGAGERELIKQKENDHADRSFVA